MLQMKKETVLVLRSCRPDLTSFGNFKWKESGVVECDDFIANYICGNGLHGFLWGEGNGELALWGKNCKWLVVEVLESDIIDLRDKVKFPKGKVVFCGDMETAMNYISSIKNNRSRMVDKIFNSIETIGDFTHIVKISDVITRKYIVDERGNIINFEKWEKYNNLLMNNDYSSLCLSITVNYSYDKHNNLLYCKKIDISQTVDHFYEYYEPFEENGKTIYNRLSSFKVSRNGISEFTKKYDRELLI